MSRFVGDRLKLIKKKVQELKIRQSDNSPEGSVTQQFGFLKFTNDEKNDEPPRLSQFIHLALKTEPETVIRFMKEAWDLSTPNLIISITGGAKYSGLSARLKKAFQVGVVSAASPSNAWIITAGTNAGVMKEVGQALNKYRYKNGIDGVDIPCIGIASWGYTAGKEQLERSMSTGSESATNIAIDAIHMNGEGVYGVQKYVVKSPVKHRCDLEPNHTHFLLFDDGQSSADSVLPLRADIEKFLRNLKIEQSDNETASVAIPIVMILFEGGPSSITTVLEALDSDTPVVVIKDSGRAADLVADIYEIVSKDIVESQDDDSTSDDRSPRRPSFPSTTHRITEINAIFSKVRESNPWAEDVKEKKVRHLIDHYM